MKNMNSLKDTKNIERARLDLVSFRKLMGATVSICQHWSRYMDSGHMKRIRKALLLPVRRVASQSHWTKIYYWSDLKLYELRAVCVMPRWYYRGLYQACLWLVEMRSFRQLADWTIHTIPYQVRFEMA